MEEKSKIVIIGAGRSGTNMIRDILTQLPGYGTWPCDEINYIWRHKNARFPTDEFTPEMATPPVRKYIRGGFDRLMKRRSIRVAVEKTCANSLRVAFVSRAVPDARYIFIHRDGRDAVASAMKRWKAPLDIPYVMKKARFVPFTDMPYYCFRYGMTRIHLLLSREKKLSSWGPRFEGITQAVKSRTLLEVCGMQWSRCVEKSLDQLDAVPPERLYRVKYENLVMRPQEEMRKMIDFVGVNVSDTEICDLTKRVSPRSVGAWKREFTDSDLILLDPVIRHAMGRLGYF